MPHLENIADNSTNDNPSTNKSEVFQSDQDELHTTAHQATGEEYAVEADEKHHTYSTTTTTNIVNSTGVVTGSALDNGDYYLYSEVFCYFTQGPSSLAVGDVSVDRTTPSTSYPLPADTWLPIKVSSSSNNYIAFKTASGAASGLVYIIPKND